MKMDMLYLLTFLGFVKISWGIQCFKCEPDQTFYHREPLMCDEFKETSEYQVDCPDSTMCWKKITTLQGINGQSSISIQRGCAHQTTNGEQRKNGRHWEPLKKVYEPYEEGCVDDSNVERITKTIQCYCRGDLCNNSSLPSINYFILMLSISIIGFS